MAHEVENMVYVGATPWHGLGVAVPEDKRLSIAEAIVAGGLDWEVKLRGLFTKDDRGAHVPVLDHYVTFRNSDNAVLGVVGKDYRPLQNLDAFKWFQPFLEGGQATIETAGSLRGGAKVWVLARIRRDPMVVGKEDLMKH
jgi:phage/plasmid-like protein (TIGR03299 family)